MPAEANRLRAVVEAAFPEADTIELLGCGDFACTFRVRTDGRDLAVKALDPELVAPREGREARALARVDSPYVVPYHGAGEIQLEGEVYPYLEMDLSRARVS